ncbi:MAG: C-GCAxxG-C-C family protein [Endomicrobium sp.]|jgi:C_GCAxxG_C_C family probable redox protein|nr:C-GCAxxG-C-C family protein [Endomicrobium sp.]
MENKSEAAKKYFMQGYNCAQAVLLAFADELQIDKEFALKLASPFGGGMGGQREVCGAVSAMFIAAGLKRGYSDAKNPEEKKRLYALIKELSDKFKAENGSIVCKELLRLQNKDTLIEKTCLDASNDKSYKKRSCAEITAFAAELLQGI